MKLYIWEGNGISNAYHDDGTLVVLAESPEQAREMVRAKLAENDDELELDWQERFGKSWPYRGEGDSGIFDGTEAALGREPDRVVELDEPTWVAFNGGGYD